MYYKINIFSYLYLKKENNNIIPTLNDNIIVKIDELGAKEITTNMYIPIINKNQISEKYEFFILKENLNKEASIEEIKDYRFFFDIHMHPIISQMIHKETSLKNKSCDTKKVTINKVKKITDKYYK